MAIIQTKNLKKLNVQFFSVKKSQISLTKTLCKNDSLGNSQTFVFLMCHVSVMSCNVTDDIKLRGNIKYTQKLYWLPGDSDVLFALFNFFSG